MRYTLTQGVEHQDDNIRRSFLIGVPLALGLLSLGPLNPSKLGSPYQPASAQDIRIAGQTSTGSPKTASKTAASSPDSNQTATSSNNTLPAADTSPAISDGSNSATTNSTSSSSKTTSNNSGSTDPASSSSSPPTVSVAGVSLGIEGKPLLSTSSLDLTAN